MNLFLSYIYYEANHGRVVSIVVVSYRIAGPSEDLGHQDQPISSKDKHR
jgi:hypothetical protein